MKRRRKEETHALEADVKKKGLEVEA